MIDLTEKIFGLQGVTVINSIIEEGNLKINGCLSSPRQHCPRCSCSHTIFKDRKKREFHLQPIGSRKATFSVQLRRLQCNECRHNWWPKLDFAKGKQRMTKGFIDHALDLLRMGTVDDVAKHLNVGWDTIKDIHKTFLNKEYEKIDLADIQYVSIDEFAIRKGHTYMTVVSDCKTGRIIHAVEGRKAEDISPFLKQLKKKALI